jgi:hypothetical protein
MTNKTIDKKPGFASRTATPVREKRDVHPQDGARNSTKEFLQMASMAVPVIGAVGTLFVWGAANLYVGDVVVVSDQQCPDMVVSVYNSKGQESSYRVNRFQLMPGPYHVEVSTDGKNKYRADINVLFRSVNRLVINNRPQIGISRLAPNAVSSVLMQAPVPAEPEDNNAKVTELQLEPASASPAHDVRPSDQEVTAPGQHESVAETENGSGQAALAAESSKPTKSVESNPAVETGATSSPSQDSQSHRKWWRVWHKSDNHN